MADLGLVACVKTKQAFAAPAASLYVSALFRKSLLAALDRCKEVRILSAKHGLLTLGDFVSPYEQTLKTMPVSERRRWGEAAGQELARWAGRKDRLVIFAGEDYLRPLSSAIAAIGCATDQPLGTRSLGARLQQLRAMNDEAAIATMLSRFARSLRRLSRAQGGGRLLSQANGRQPWPQRGVYLVTETVGPNGRDVITRVGTHAVSAGSRTTLWDRVSTHRGTGHGGGSHRSSIFRSHVGRALLRRGGCSVPASWGQGQSAPAEVRLGEDELERRVSQTLGDMRLLWLDVPDSAGPASDRAYLERNLIGLLSRADLLGLRAIPNSSWLGHDSSDWRIAASGLWNLDHLFHRPDPAFLDVFDAFVEATMKGATGSQEPRAPAGWRRPLNPAAITIARDDQLSLFEEESRHYDA